MSYVISILKNLCTNGALSYSKLNATGDLKVSSFSFGSRWRFGVLQEAGASSRLFSACLLQHFGIAEAMRRAGRASGTRQQVGTLVVEGTEWTGTGVLVLQEPSWSWHSRWAFHRSACFLFPLLRLLTSITKELNWAGKNTKSP